MRKLILANNQSPSEIVMLTAAIRDIHLCHPGQFQTDVRTPCPGFWKNNPYVTALEKGTNDTEVIRCNNPQINESNDSTYHYIHGFQHFLSGKLGVTIAPTALKGDIYLSEKERGWILQFEDLVDEEIPFWIVVAGGSPDCTIKWWETCRYQEVIDQFAGRIRFVQVGDKNHYQPPLKNVLDLRGKTDLRQLVRLVYHSQGVLSPVTLLMHLAAAVPSKKGMPPSRPCVVVAGGREPVTWEKYSNHQFLHTQGALTCCKNGGCWKSRTVALNDGAKCDRNLCVDVINNQPRCMDMITVHDVVRRIELYFEGGLTSYFTGHERDVLPSQGSVSKTASKSGSLQQASSFSPAMRELKTYIRFAGMKRHGNHGVINWLISQFDGRVCFRNNAGKVENMVNTVCDSIEALKSPKRSKVDLESPGDKELFLVSFEDKALDRIFDVKRLARQEKWIKHRITQEFRVVLLRDPYNYFASRLQGERNGGFKGDLRFSDSPDVSRLCELWKAYARCYLQFEEASATEEVAISYNHWVMYPDYREQICRKFGRKLIDNNAHTIVSGWGNGSSFNGRKYQPVNSYLRRWENFADESVFREILSDKDLLALSDRIFGDTIHSESVLSICGQPPVSLNKSPKLS